MALMDRTVAGVKEEGLKVESQIERKLAANIGVYTETANCSGQNDVHGFGNLKRNTVFKAIDWVNARLQDNHDSISEFSLVLQENQIRAALNCDTDVQCIVQ